MLISALVFLTGSSIAPATARDIIFPSIAGSGYFTGQMQSPLANIDDVDIVTGSSFSGLTTYAHLPYTNCFADKGEVEKYDIAILGAPFDTVGRSSLAWCLLACLCARSCRFVVLFEMLLFRPAYALKWIVDARGFLSCHIFCSEKAACELYYTCI